MQEISSFSQGVEYAAMRLSVRVRVFFRFAEGKRLQGTEVNKQFLLTGAKIRERRVLEVFSTRQENDRYCKREVRVCACHD